MLRLNPALSIYPFLLLSTVQLRRKRETIRREENGDLYVCVLYLSYWLCIVGILH